MKSGRWVVAIDTLEHAQLVLRSLRSSINSQNRHLSHAECIASNIHKFDDLVIATGQILSNAKKREQRIETLLQQQLPASSSMDKALDMPYEQSSGKVASMYISEGTRLLNMGQGSHRPRNNHHDEEDFDFSSDDEDGALTSKHRVKTKSTSHSKLERIALNRPSKSTNVSSRDGDGPCSSSLPSPRSPMSPGNNSFYDDEEAPDSNDERDNEALFFGFAAPTISDEPLAASQSVASAAPSKAGSVRPTHGGCSSSSSSIASSYIVNTGGSGQSAAPTTMKISKVSSVPTSPLKCLPKGIIVSKGGIFVRSGSRRKKEPE